MHLSHRGALRYGVAMSLEVTDLSIARGGVRVLEGVSFTLAPGQALVLYDDSRLIGGGVFCDLING